MSYIRTEKVVQFILGAMKVSGLKRQNTDTLSRHSTLTQYYLIVVPLSLTLAQQ